jgi:predicted regulator of Ras-like GTPase activity (Roadblock/LC7/MglB family)
MFTFLKSFLKRPQTATPDSNDTEVVEQEQAAQEIPQAAPSHASAVRSQRGRASQWQQPVGVPVRLQSVIDSLPLELHPRIVKKNAGEAVIAVALEKVLAQISRGAVKISFGELRQLAPGYFSNQPDRDKTLVALPLSELIANLNPALLSRRRVQRHVEVPDEISSPFDLNGDHGVSRQAEAAEEEPSEEVETPGADSLDRNPISFALEPVVPQAPIQAAPRLPATRGPIAMPMASAPVQPLQVQKPISMAPIAQKVAAQPAASQPAAPAPATKLAAATKPADAKPQVEPFVLNLTALAEGWPDAVRAEIVHLKLVDAKIHLPFEAVEQGLRQGKLSFSWKNIKSFIKGGGTSMPSQQDVIAIELPLKVVAPLFLARQKEESKDKQKVQIDAEIPNLFFGFPQPDAGRSVSKPIDTNYYVWDDNADTAIISADEVKKKNSPGTSFMTRYATPNEVVSRAAAIDGVAGALVALPDGLMVASRVSADLNGDTLAAFLPQIFARITPCTRELRMGELNNLGFTVGNVPWKIFRVNAIFFAAFGKAGESLPTSQLAALAAELDHKPK